MAQIGTYVCGIIADHTAANLDAWCIKHSIPSPVTDFHTSVLFSRRAINVKSILAELSPSEIDLKIVGFDIFQSRDDVGGENALVLVIDAPQLTELHEKFIAAGGTHDFDDFTPHISLSYSIPADFDVHKLTVPDFEVKIKHFRVEPLDLGNS